MNTLKSQVAEIIKVYLKLLNGPLPDLVLSGMINAGNGMSVIVSSQIEKMISKVARDLKRELNMTSGLSLTVKVTDKEWRKMVRSAFGPVLLNVNSDSDTDQTAEAGLFEIKKSLTEKVTSYGSCEFIFACTLFPKRDFPPIVIGPVRFESRMDWLARKKDEELLSPIAYRRLQCVWSGGKLHDRVESKDTSDEESVIKALTAPYVCSVATTGLAAEAGREKSLTAARLGLLAMSLLWQMPSSALSGMNLLYDRQMHAKVTIGFKPSEGIVISNSSISQMLFAHGLPDAGWEALQIGQEKYFDMIGRILDRLITAEDRSSDSTGLLVDTLAQGMLWFHEGARASLSEMAIVCYAATLDTLAGGKGKAAPILKLFEARFGIKKNDPITVDKQTLKRAINQVYSTGRSRLIHGTYSMLGHDSSETRYLAEWLARKCLVACINWAANNPDCDDPAGLLVLDSPDIPKVG